MDRSSLKPPPPPPPPPKKKEKKRKKSESQRIEVPVFPRDTRPATIGYNIPDVVFLRAAAGLLPFRNHRCID